MSTEHRQPLDAEERELARVLRALPAGEPPSALDAKILAAARDAVVATPNLPDEARPRPRRAPRFAWGLGVAASCVLAAGLVYRMGGFGAESLDGVGAPATEAASDAVREPAPAMPETQEDHIRVELGAPRAEPAPTIAIAPPPLPEPDLRRREQQRAAPAAAAPATADSAEVFAADEPAIERRDLAEPSAEIAEVAEPEVSAAPAMAPAPPAPAAAAAERQTLDSVVVTGTRVDPDVARPVSEDGRAGAQVWIQRIRARIARGDVEGARESLEAFIERHPDKVLPQDLIDFRAGHARE